MPDLLRPQLSIAVPIHHTCRKRKADVQFGRDEDFPSCYCEYFHEETMLTILLCLLDCLEEVEAMVPVDTQEVPAVYTELALEEQVICIFLNISITQDTSVVITINFVVLSFEQVSGVESVSEQQPYKGF